MGKGAPKVFDYLLSLHYGICHGPIDGINDVKIHEKRVWCGSVNSRRDVCIDLPDVFGGDEKEGGVRGIAECYMGDFEQVASESLAGRMGLTPLTAPAYRGVASIFFRGMYGGGFKWITNNPYVPTIDVSVTKLYRELNNEFAVIWPLGETAPPVTTTWAVPLEPDGNTYEKAESLPGIIPIPGIGPNGPESSYLSEYRPIGQPENLYCSDGSEFDGYVQSVFDATEIQYDEDGQPINGHSKGISFEEIDSGNSTMTVSFQAVFTSSYSSATPLGVCQVYVYFYTGVVDPETGEMLPGEYIRGSLWAKSGSGTVANINGTFPIPVGARFYKAYTGQNAYPFSRFDRVNFSTITMEWAGLEYTHCKVDAPPLLPDANPANFMYELFTNYDWGLGEDPDMINIASFQAASETLFNERFGITFTWVQQADGETIQQEVCDHIKALLFQDPVDAKWTIRLLRNDYDFNSLEILNPDNCEVVDSRRRLWGEVTNEIVVTYTDAETEEDATVTAHNGGTLAIQPGIASDSRNYYMVRNARLAQALADRDVAEAGYPLWNGSLKLSRRFWNVRPGDVFRLQSPDDEILDMVIRILTIQPGRPGAREIVVTATEDIFSVSTTQYREPQVTLSDDRPKLPSDLTMRAVISAPYATLMIAGFTPTEVADEFPASALIPMGFHSEKAISDIEVWVKSGLSSFNSGRISPVPCVFSTIALVEEAETEIPRAIIDSLGGGMLFPGDYLMIGNSDSVSEIIRLDAFNRAGQFWFAQRGMYDTVPRQWPIGSEIWIMPSSTSEFLKRAYAPDAEIELKLLPRIGANRLDMGAATPYDLTVVPRAYLPTRPAKCQIMWGILSGFGFAPAIFDTEPYPTNIVVTWTNRNRLQDESAHPVWDTMAFSSLEPGQTTTIRIRDTSGLMLVEYDAGTAEEWSFPVTDLGSSGTGYVEFIAVRDGYESIQFARRFVTVGSNLGYGNGWGISWG